jgi:hypothetical protein
MAAMLDIGTGRRARLRRLSVVFAVELRLRIVAELCRREMSPPQFLEEFGGGSISRVNKNFERLVETGWLSYVRSEGPGGKRHGAVEHFYRSTELAILMPKLELWFRTPMRVASSVSLFNQRRTEVGVATSAARKYRLTKSAGSVYSRPLALSFRASSRSKNSRIRVRFSGEELIQADVLIIAFESPTRGDPGGLRLVESNQDLMVHFPERLAPFLGDDACAAILEKSSRREMSATQFHREHGATSLSGVRRRFKRLKNSGWLKRVGKKTGGQRRGATEDFYRATKPVINSDT